jgi:phage terminase Nu1 subunit (DNA packaging protein)
MPTVKIDQVAGLLNLTPQRVHQLVKEGLPKEKRGEYDGVKCMFWYIRYLQGQISRLSPNVDLVGGEADAERKERLRLLRADAELRELELARERGEFMALTDVEKLMSDLVIMTKARLLALPNRLAPQLEGEGRVVIETRLDRALKEVLTILAQGNGNGDGSGADTSERVSPLEPNKPARS